MNVGRAIKLCRTQKNMKLTDLAERSQISVSYLSLLERGKRDPNLSTIQSVADGLGIPISILMFLAAEEGELPGIRPDIAEKLSYVALDLMKKTANDGASL